MLRGPILLLKALWRTLRGRVLGRPLRRDWPFQFEVVIRFLRLDWEETAAWEFPRLRAENEARPYPRKFAKLVNRNDTELSGVPVSRITPPSKGPRKELILFLHGGSYIFGSAKTTHAEIISQLAYETGREVVAPDFRLAPENVYPAQLEDVLAVYQGLVESGTEDIVLIGDSSGGNLATALALELRDRKVGQPKALGLISPWCDLHMPGRSCIDNDPYDFGTREVLARQARAFAGPRDPSDPRVSPTNANLEGLCPCLVVAGELEILRDDILLFHDKLCAAGVQSELYVSPSMPHNPPAFVGLHPQSLIAFRKLVSFVQAHLSTSAG